MSKIWAYWTDQCKVQDAKFHPAFDRIRHCGKWNYQMLNRDGEKGVLAFWGKEKPTPRDLAEPVQLHDDGLWYYSPGKMDQKELAKEQSFPKIDYTTRSGYQLSIPLAVGGPRMVNFLDMTFGEPSDDFPKKAMELETAILDGEEIHLDDRRLLSLVMSAIMQTYSVTAELLGELGWIDSGDIEPIYEIIRGVYPKLESDEEITSSSSSQELNEMGFVPSASGKAS